MGDYLGEVMERSLVTNHPLEPGVSLEFNSGGSHVQESRREKPTCIQLLTSRYPANANWHRDADTQSIGWL